MSLTRVMKSRLCALVLLLLGCGKEAHYSFHYGSGKVAPQHATFLAPVEAPVRKPHVAVILCKFRDQPAEIRNRSFYEDFYIRRGTGGMADFWYDATLGVVDLTESTVFGWYTMDHDSSEVRNLVFPGGRHTLVQWGRETAAANGVDLSKFATVIVVQNWGVDHGDAGNGIVIVDQHPDLLESTFIAHEMGHMLGLPHSFGENMSPCISGSGEYCDAWDIMSAMNVFSYPCSFEGVHGNCGPGLNVFGARALGGLPPDRVASLSGRTFDQTITLGPMNTPAQPGMHYAVQIEADSPRNLFTVEYRHKAGLDEGLPHDAVLVHEEKNQRSYLVAALVPGETYSTPEPHVRIEVVSIDGGKAVVRCRAE